MTITGRIIAVMRRIGDEAGSLAVSFGLGLPVVLVLAGIVTDYAMMVRYRAQLQAVADAAAIAGAREFALVNDNPAQIETIVESFATQNAKDDSANFEVSTTIDQAQSTLSVTVTKRWRPVFAHLLDTGVTPVSAHASARLVGGSRICALGLHPSASGTIALSGEARLTANKCVVLSNSSSASGLASYMNSLITADLICSSGGVGGSAGNFSPAPLTDCPVTPDPLQSRTPPQVGLCDFVNFSVSGKVQVLAPGTYCGGILIANGADVTFSPGIYVIKGGRFSVTHTSRAYGKDVGFYLTGSGATLLFAAGTTVELYAPREGGMAGLLFFEDRAAPLDQVHDIISENARQLVGTIYLSRGTFQVGSKKPIADLSAYTAIVARRIVLNKYPSLVLNSNYHLTDVPVPSGLSDFGGRVVLTN